MNQDQQMNGISEIDWSTIPWVRSTLLNDKVVKLSKAKVYVFSDSMFCLGCGIGKNKRSVASWKTKLIGSKDRIIFMSIYNDIDWGQ